MTAPQEVAALPASAAECVARAAVAYDLALAVLVDECTARAEALPASVRDALAAVRRARGERDRALDTYHAQSEEGST